MKFMNINKHFYQDAAGAEGGDAGGGAGAEGDAEGQEADESGEGADADGSDGSDDDGADEGKEGQGVADWRDEYLQPKDADGNDIDEETLTKRRNVLSRFASKEQFTQSYFDLHKKVRAGVKEAPVLPEDATEEQIKEYRKELGLPETTDDYKVTLPEGMVLDETDQTIVDGLKATALDSGVKPEVFSSIVAKNLELREEQMVARQNRDAMLNEQSAKSLHERWDADYQPNINAIDNTFNAMPGGDDPEGLRMQFENARMANGDRVFDNPEMMNFFATLARRANPQSTLSTGEGGTSIGRKAALEKKMQSGESLSMSERNELATLKDALKGQ